MSRAWLFFIADTEQAAVGEINAIAGAEIDADLEESAADCFNVAEAAFNFGNGLADADLGRTINPANLTIESGGAGEHWRRPI